MSRSKPRYDLAEEQQVAKAADPVIESLEASANSAHAEIRAHKIEDPGTPVGLTKTIARRILRAAQFRMVQPAEPAA